MKAFLPSLLVFLAAATPASSQVMPIQMAPNLKGTDYRPYKQVTSFKGMKFRGLVRQRTDFSCGAAALATILTYAYDRPTREREVLVDMFEIADEAVVREKGFSLLDLKNYTQSIGMKGEGYEVPYDALEQLRVPGIVLLDIKGYKHFVVIRKVADGFVHLADPAVGNRVMPRHKFTESWNGIVFVVLGENYDPENALRDPPPPLSARRLFDQRSPIQNAEPRDFDIGRATSFVF